MNALSLGTRIIFLAHKLWPYSLPKQKSDQPTPLSPLHNKNQTDFGTNHKLSSTSSFLKFYYTYAWNITTLKRLEESIKKTRKSNKQAN